MVRHNLKGLAARVAAKRYGAKPDDRDFIRLAYELGGKGEPDADRYLRHEAELARGLSRADLLKELVNEGRNETAGGGAPADHVLTGRVPPEDVDDLVRLAFRSLLRRDADAETYAAYRDGFERGTTFVDLINDVIQSEEFKIIDERIERLSADSNRPASPAPEHPIASDMDGALTLLETRLGEKGCRLHLGAVAAGTIDSASVGKRMTNLLITLSVLDRL